MEETCDCGKFVKKGWGYCPNCGSKMISEEENKNLETLGR